PGNNGGCGPSPFGAGYDHLVVNAPNPPPLAASGLCDFGLPFLPPRGSNDLPGAPSGGFGNGHEGCSTTTTGLGGLAYDAESQTLVFENDPSPGTECELRFCTDDEVP